MASTAPLRALARTPAILAFAVVVAYGATLELAVRSHLGTAHHHDHVGLVVHWLRDATMVLPAVFGAVWAAVACVRRLLDRADASTPLAAAAIAGTAAVVGATAFGGLRLVTHGDETGLPLAWEVAASVLPAFVIAVLVAGVAAAATLASSAAGRRSLKSAVVIACAAALAGTAAWQAEASVPDESVLRDVIQPCFDDSPVAPPFTARMPVPPRATTQGVDALTGTVSYQIDEVRSETEIIPGIKTPVWTYNGSFPGPTVVARKLRPTRVTFTNKLPPGDDPSSIIYRTPPSEEHHFVPSSTAVHLHGINAEHASDGYPDDGDGHKHRRSPGESDTFTFPNNEYQRPATLWYHDHSVHITSAHAYRGLAGFYIVQDEQEDELRLPGSPLADPLHPGVADDPTDFDVPLLLRDVMIDPATGILVYDNCSHKGAYGDVMTVNGKQQPRFSVASRKYRFRMVNGSDARQYLLALRTAENVGRPSDDTAANEPFTLIGTDHGLLPAPEPLKRFHTTPAERHELVIDFSRYPLGTRLVFVNLLAEPSNRKLFPLMAFDVERVEPDASQVPPVLRGSEHPADVAPPSATRVFEFHRSDGKYWSINGKIFDALRDDARPALNSVEDWILVNDSGGWGHPVHLHLGRFKIVKIEGRAPNPGELSGWKDVVWLGPNQRITVRHQFWNFTDRFVFHCHNGSHEDFDMMGQFNVQPASLGLPADTTPPTVSILVPADGTTVAGTATVAAAAVDGVGVAGVRFSLDGATIGEDSMPPYTVDWNTTTVADGPHTLNAIARDTSGNENISNVVRVVVDNP